MEETTAKLIMGVVLAILITIGVCVIYDAWNSRRMAQLGFCYQRVESMNIAPLWTWSKCK